MKASGKLISKEFLPRNFKLTFLSRIKKYFFVIIHSRQKKIFKQLEINENYYFSCRRGKKNYSFVDAISIKKIKPKILSNTKTDNGAREIFLKGLSKNLKIKMKNLGIEILSYKLDNLKKKSKIRQGDNLIFALKRAEELIKLLFLKYRELEKFPTTEQEKAEKDFLTKISTLFLIDYTYPKKT